LVHSSDEQEVQAHVAASGDGLLVSTLLSVEFQGGIGHLVARQNFLRQLYFPLLINLRSYSLTVPPLCLHLTLIISQRPHF
jgi:hypothetical protein